MNLTAVKYLQTFHLKNRKSVFNRVFSEHALGSHHTWLWLSILNTVVDGCYDNKLIGVLKCIHSCSNMPKTLVQLQFH